MEKRAKMTTARDTRQSVAGEIEDKREQAKRVIRQRNNKLKISGNEIKLRRIHRAREARQGQARQGQNRQRAAREESERREGKKCSEQETISSQ